MQSKIVLGSLIFLSGVAALVFSFIAGKEIFRYCNLHQKTHVTTITWTMEREGGDRFVLKANYTYEVGGKSYQGSDVPFVYRNPYVALDALRDCKEKLWTVCYGTHGSALVRVFPYKYTVYASLLWGLMLYFSFLSLYHNRHLRDYVCEMK